MDDLKPDPKLHGLMELGKRDGVDIRPTLLRVVTDLYVAKAAHSAAEERQYTELALRLVDLVDDGTRSIVAKRLAEYPHPPRAVIERLASGSEPPRTASIEPARESIGSIGPDESPVPMTLPRSRASATEVTELFLAAAPDERRLILENIEYAPIAPAEPPPRANARAFVHRLEAAALAHNLEGFAAEVENALGIARPLARRLISDSSGEPIVTLAAALDAGADVVQRILLCLNPEIGRSVQRVYELAALYESVEQSSALRLVAIWRAAGKSEQRRSAAGHQPQTSARRSNTDPIRALTPRPALRWEELASRKVEGG